MANTGNAELYLPDGSFDWSGGVDSSSVTTIQSPLNVGGLARNQLAWLFNSTVRGGGITQRTGFQPLLKVLSQGYYWQGGYIYEPDSANPHLVCMISGVLYRVLLEPPYTVSDLTGGNPALQNPGAPTVAEMAWFCQGENYLVIQAGDYFTVSPPTRPLIWDGTLLRRSKGITDVNATIASPPHTNEIPAATCMDYYGGRLWYAQGRQYSAGDMVGGPTGTLVAHFRDSILCVQENPLCVGGDGFTVPTNAGNIRALAHSANINSQLGEGVLYISTRKTIYSLAVPVTRTDWIGANSTNQPLQTVVQLVNGAVGDRSVVVVNGDIFYQSLEPAIRSLQISVRNFGQWGNTPISQNELRALAANDRGLMRFSSGIQFDNRMLQLVMPVLANDGVNVVHQAILPLDFDVVSNLSTQGPTNVSGTSAVRAPVWEGAYDGLQFLQLFERDFGGLHRGFSAVISAMDGSIEIWELTTTSRTENGDNRITWGAESPAFTWSPSGLEVKLKQLKGGECWIDSVSGTVDMDVWYREDADPCWRYWFHTQFCSGRDCREKEPVCINPYPPIPFREGYRYPVVFPEPKAACDSMGIRPTTIGYQFQVKVILKGWCRVRGLILYAIPHSEPQYHGIACQTPTMAKIKPPPVTPIIPPLPPVLVPVNLTVPVITGTAKVGQTLSGSNGTWSNSPTGYTYQWLANGTPIGGATANTFLLTIAQLGEVITFQVTASNAGGSGSPATSLATSAVIPIPIHALATAWAAQVVTNGGAAPSGATVSALSTFCYSLDAASLTAKMIAVNCFAPDSLIAAQTPLIHNFGYVKWVNDNNAFLAGDITVNGLQADGAVHSKFLHTGIIPSACMTDSSASIIHYCTQAGSSNSARMGAADASGALRFAWFNAAGLGDYFCCLDSADQFGTGNTAGYFLGYICGSKTTSSIRNIYKANSTTPHSSAGSNNVSDAKTPPAIELYCFVSNENGTFSSANCYPGTLSFAAVGTALSAADSLALYNAVQALRMALGGGFL